MHVCVCAHICKYTYMNLHMHSVLTSSGGLSPRFPPTLALSSHLWWVMAHIRMRHGTHTNKSWHTHEWVMAHIQMRHVSNESSHEGVTSQMSHTTNESCLEHVMAPTRMSPGTHTNELWHTYKWVMSRMSQVTDDPRPKWVTSKKKNQSHHK